jgi:tetratricopeptide (TPR) repeat protein
MTGPVVALAGRRVDAPDAEEPRFPLADIAAVRERLRASLRAADATAIVCSAACGADLLALDTAADLGIRRRIVLPFAKERFRETSVVDRPGVWGELFDRLIADAERTGDLVVLDTKDRDRAYHAANRAILEVAARIASAPTEAWIVWNGRARSTGDVTLHFADEAWQREIPVREIVIRQSSQQPSADRDFHGMCFVVMPFGTKPGDDGRIPFDAIYSTIIAPAIESVTLPEGGSLQAYRTDKGEFAGLIDQNMFECLEYSRMVFCDITTLNANVFYELGIRHKCQSFGTVMFRQTGTKLPFDIQSVKVFEYELRQPENSRRDIARVVEESMRQKRIDSPVLRFHRPAQRAAVDCLLQDAENALLKFDPATAIAKYAAASKLDPNDASILVRLATLEKGADHWNEALAAATEATRIAPEYPEAWRERGVAEGQVWRTARMKAGIPDGIASLEHAIKLNSKDFDALASLGGILRRQKRLPEALDAYRRSAEVSNGHPYPLLNMIKLQAAVDGRLDLSTWKNTLERAARIRSAQAAMVPPTDPPWSLFDLAEIRMYQGDVADAMGHLEQAITWCEDNGSLQENGKVAVFRDTLRTLIATGVKVAGLDELLQRAEQAVVGRK